MNAEKRNERTEWNRIVGEQIAIRREERGLTQAQLAFLAFGSPNKWRISIIESGKNAPEAHNLFRLARALHCSMDFFYGPIKRENLVTF